MAFHVPFNQRHSARRHAPIYIGFDVPAAPPRRKFNWWGFNGMWMSFASLVMTAGFLAPIPLIISLVGLRKPGKKMAAVGAITSLIGIGLAVALVFGAIADHSHRAHRQKMHHYRTVVKKQVEEASSLLSVASREITEFRDSHDGALPNDIDANMLVIKHVDPWGESLRYDAELDHAIVRSAGPDRQFDTSDDVMKEIKGKTDRTPLLPIE
jgi:hypothetical protein